MSDKNPFYEISICPKERKAAVRFHGYWPQDVQKYLYYDVIIWVLAKHAGRRPDWDERIDINGLNWSYEFVWTAREIDIKADM